MGKCLYLMARLRAGTQQRCIHWSGRQAAMRGQSAGGAGPVVGNQMAVVKQCKRLAALGITDQNQPAMAAAGVCFQAFRPARELDGENGGARQSRAFDMIDGMIIAPRMNSRSVLPREIRAGNGPTNGVTAIHQAQ